MNITVEMFDKLVATFGFEHPMTTLVWNDLSEKSEKFGGEWFELFESIYHKYVWKSNQAEK